MGEAAKKDDDEKLIPVGPGAEGLDEAKPDKDEEEPEDKRLASGEETEEGEEEKPGSGKRRESAKERRERAKKARDRERLEYNFLLKRNEDLEKRFANLEGRTAQTETAAIDSRINTIQAQLNNADRVIADALKKPNGGGSEEVVEALKIRDELRDQLSELGTSKQQRSQTTTQQAQQRRPTESAPDPRTLRHAREWAGQHEWFDFAGNDEDSVIVRAIDESLAGDGFDPSTTEYWEELTDRVKRRLPEKFKATRARADEDDDEVEEDEKPRPKAGPKFSSGGRERPLKKGEVYVSAERKEAMKQYGVWDDPVARNRMLAKYAKWDADSSASGNRS